MANSSGIPPSTTRRNARVAHDAFGRYERRVDGTPAGRGRRAAGGSVSGVGFGRIADRRDHRPRSPGIAAGLFRSQGASADHRPLFNVAAGAARSTRPCRCCLTAYGMPPWRRSNRNDRCLACPTLHPTSADLPDHRPRLRPRSPSLPVTNVAAIILAIPSGRGAAAVGHHAVARPSRALSA